MQLDGSDTVCLCKALSSLAFVRWSFRCATRTLFTTFSALRIVHPSPALTRAFSSHCARSHHNDLFLALAVANVQQDRHAERFFLELTLCRLHGEHIDGFIL